MELDFKKKLIIGGFIVVILLISGYLYYDYINNSNSASINIEEIDSNDVNESKIEKTLLGDNNFENENTIVVHIVGAVKNPGIVKIKEGARLYEVIDKAGGNLEDADLSKVNLAYTISDGQKIYIPRIGEIINEQNEITEYISSSFGNNELIEDGNGIESGGGKVNINTASQTELETLPGIGPSTAQKIIDYRSKNGKFEAIEDIQNVKGIGDAKYEDIKDNICV